MRYVFFGLTAVLSKASTFAVADSCAFAAMRCLGRPFRAAPCAARTERATATAATVGARYRPEIPILLTMSAAGRDSRCHVTLAAGTLPLPACLTYRSEAGRAAPSWLFEALRTVVYSAGMPGRDIRSGLPGRRRWSAHDVQEALVISGEIPLWLVDGDDRVAFVNHAAVRTLGFDSDDELIGRPSHDSVHYKHPDGSPYPVEDCPITHATERGEPVRIERDWWVRRDGSIDPDLDPLRSAGDRRPNGDRDDVPRPQRERAGRGRTSAARDRSVRVSPRSVRRGPGSSRQPTSERRRVARDLHDGAQSSLVRVAIALQLAMRREDVTGEARAHVGEALDNARSAIEELRELVHGIHPAVLTHRGLAAAVKDLAGRAPAPVAVEIADERYPSSVELAAYFVTAEALTNVAKYARASKASRYDDADGEPPRVDSRRRWHRRRATIRRERPRRARRPHRDARRHAHRVEPTGPGDERPRRDPPTAVARRRRRP